MASPPILAMKVWLVPSMTGRSLLSSTALRYSVSVKSCLRIRGVAPGSSTM